MEILLEKQINSIYRVTPHNIQAEQILLGVFLSNNEHLNKVSDFLRQEHFFEPIHQKIFEAIEICVEKGLIATPITLKNKFDQEESLKEIGGAEYLIKLTSLATTIVNIIDYAKTVYDLAIRRKLINLGEDIVNNAYEENLETTSSIQIERAEHSLYKLASEGSDANAGFKPIKTSLIDAINRAQLAYKNKEKITGVSTGFLDMDGILGGFQDSDLVIIAGRPSMGKTALAINLALNSCLALQKDHNKDLPPPAIGIFSLEMSSEQLATRMLSISANINASKIRNGSMNEDEFGKIIQANKDLYQLPIFIDDTPSISIAALRARARRLKRKNNLGIIFVDYLQLIRGVNRTSEANRVQEISEITQTLKAIAKELNVPIIALSQLSRAVEQREDKRPQLSDLRESGSIEQDADIVMFIYREEYYLLRKQPPEGTEKHVVWQEEMNKAMNLSDIIIAKHRNGPVGNVKLHFDSMTTRFNNFVPDY
jgi:replicative DNA helicase